MISLDSTSLSSLLKISSIISDGSSNFNSNTNSPLVPHSQSYSILKNGNLKSIATKTRFNNKVQILYYHSEQSIEMIRERILIRSILISQMNFDELEWIKNNDLVRREPFHSLNSLTASKRNENGHGHEIGNGKEIMNSKGENEKMAEMPFPTIQNDKIKGEIIVANLAMEKRVIIRYSFDEWKSWNEIDATFSRSMIALKVDRFVFEISIPALSLLVLPMQSCESMQSMPLISSLESSSLTEMERRIQLEFACRFECGGNVWWNNNKNQNYKIDLMVKYEKAQRFENLSLEPVGIDNDNLTRKENENVDKNSSVKRNGNGEKNDKNGNHADNLEKNKNDNTDKRDRNRESEWIIIRNKIENDIKDETTIATNVTRNAGIGLNIPRMTKNIQDNLYLSSSPPIIAK